MSENITNQNDIEIETRPSLKERLGINKKKILTSLLVSFAAPFALLICSGFSVFFANSSEFNFSFGDFAPLWILGSLLVGGIFFTSLIFTKGIAYNSLFSLYSCVAILGFVQNTVTTLTFKGMPGDGNVAFPSPAKIIINFALWVTGATIIFWYSAMSNKAKQGRTVISFLLVLVMVMQFATSIPSAINYFLPDEDSNSATANNRKMVYLTTDNLFEVSTKDNIIVFVLDRFDSYYFNELINSDSSYLDCLDGFTYYADNISTYPRTYPAVTSMLTGINNDFTSRTDYFTQAYSDSPFLRDIEANGYKINLYIPTYYAYDDAKIFGDIVANASDAQGYTVDNHFALTGKMFELSSYFWAPEMLKSNTISSDVFNSVVSLDGDAPKYEMTQTSDAEFYDQFCEEGISTQSEKGTFTFLHLRGCHSPFTLDEECNIKAVSDNYHSLAQTTGVFKFITEYLQQLKDKGLYDDATIIITGDHGSLTSDRAPYENSILTALLVKEKGKSGTPLQTSYAQVSQANFHATVIKSANIQTDVKYGMAYSDVPVGETVERTHYFQTYTGNDHNDVNYTYTITGPGADFNNWKITDTTDLGYLYR